MAVANLNSIGSMAEHLAENFPYMPSGVSGNLIEIVDMARQHVANFTGQTIGSNSIGATYQPAILDFSKADIVDLVNAQAGGERLRLADLSIDETGEDLSAEQYRMLGEMKLKSIGRKSRFARSLS